MKHKLKEELKEADLNIDLYKLRREVVDKVYAKKYLCDPDGDTIQFAKEIARKHKIKFQSILAGMRPCGNINRPVWDENGKIVPYKKIFGYRLR